MGMDRDLGQGGDAGTSQPWGLLSVPQSYQGQAQWFLFFFFPIDIVSLQSFY